MDVLGGSVVWGFPSRFHPPCLAPCSNYLHGRVPRFPSWPTRINLCQVSCTWDELFTKFSSKLIKAFLFSWTSLVIINSKRRMSSLKLYTTIMIYVTLWTRLLPSDVSHAICYELLHSTMWKLVVYASCEYKHTCTSQAIGTLVALGVPEQALSFGVLL